MLNFKLTVLSSEEKTALKTLKNHPWFSVLKKIEEDQRNQLGDMLIRMNIDEEKSRDIIKRSQYYAQGRADFLKAVEMNSMETITANMEWLSFSDLDKTAEE